MSKHSPARFGDIESRLTNSAGPAIGDRADVERSLSYLEALYGAVRDGMLAGRSLEQLQQDIRLDDFSSRANYEQWLPLNIAGVYRIFADQSYMLKRPEVAKPE